MIGALTDKQRVLKLARVGSVATVDCLPGIDLEICSSVAWVKVAAQRRNNPMKYIAEGKADI